MRSKVPRGVLLVLLVCGACSSPAAPPTPGVLDPHEQFARFDFWDNRDFDWFAERIPLLHTPDAAIDETWYYRWEVLTKHLVYGSPEVGYTFTEFTDRPFWSGAYGGISCPLGHQMYEVRWLDDRRIVDDFARYWLEAPGAEPRSYSNWYADSVWATYRVLGDRDWIVDMLPLMERQYEGWMAERWDPEHRMFRWDGMHDGMETNINSRQTPQWFDGAEGYRPTLNAYLWADMRAIANAAELAGDAGKAEVFRGRAAELKERVQEELWDPERAFFFQQFADREQTVADPWPGAGNRMMGNAATSGARIEADGTTPPIEAGTLTYETGPWAGDPHGRELIGYVPWQFGLPDPGYEEAWHALFDSERFATEFGPTTTERNDPLFYVSPRCCVWSGNSWPYATTQTLVALANLVNDYDQEVAGAAEYFEVLQAYTRLHRKGGRPYVAEAADPYTGSWAGHDTWFHSEHYLHSGYIDPVVAGLIGLRPQDDDRVVVNPLVPDEWDWFALDGIAYRGHELAVIWDRDGSRWGRGAGLQLIVDGGVAARSDAIERIEVELAPAPPASPPARPHDLAVHNDATWFPAVSTSSARPEAPGEWAVDGQYWYHTTPPNRWMPADGGERDWLQVDFGVARRFHEVTLYFPDDTTGPPDPVAEGAPAFLQPWLSGGDHPPAAPPLEYTVSVRQGGEWRALDDEASRLPAEPAGRRANRVRFPPLEADAVRVELVHRPGTLAGLSEIEVWGKGPLPLAPPERAPANLAFTPAGEPARVRASYSAPDTPVERVTDGRVAFNLYSDGPWTAAGSPNDADWIEVDLGREAEIERVEIYLWAWPGRGTEVPAAYEVQVPAGEGWRAAPERRRQPERPQGLARNVVELEPVRTDRVRVRFVHAPDGAVGVTELRVFGSR